ncbi:MAG: hypothetical protein H7248_03010 [Microbacteriaceae bacterium]|nr:hypothetical protein [Microbacteriaceae bacterium]
MGDQLNGGRRKRHEPTLQVTASVAQRLAVLLSAGVPPAASWQYLAELPLGAPNAGVNESVKARVTSSGSTASSSASALLVAIAEGARTGRPVAGLIVDSLNLVDDADAPAWRGLAAAWHVATAAGAPLAPTLRDFATSLRNLAQIQRDLRTALAAPAATARLVMGLPLVAILFGFALGFDPLAILFGTPLGGACLVVGVLLMLAARGWNRALLARAQPRAQTPGLVLELMAIAVSGGASIERATMMRTEAMSQCGIGAEGSSRVLEEVLMLSSRAGVPAAALLRSEAEEARRQARSDGELRAQNLTITLMLPLGLCVLPAFMLLGVAPLLISVVTSTIAGF